jgi:hypothetical protein
MEACLESKELNPEDMECEVEHLEVPTEETAVKSLETTKKRHRGRHLAAGRCGVPKELTRGDCGSRRKLSATCRKVSHHAAVARCKRNVFRKSWTQGNCGPWKELVAPGREMTRCAEVAQRREHGLQRQGKHDMALRTAKERTSRMNHWKGPECKIRIKDPGTIQKLCRAIERTSDGIDRKTFILEFVNRAPGMFNGLWKVADWTVRRR